MARFLGGVVPFDGAGAGFGVLNLTLLASTATWIVGGIFEPAFAQQQSAATSYSVPAGSLGSAISRFGDSTGLQVLYPADLVRGKQSSGVSGSMTREDALARILSGTGLSYRFTNANTVTIVDSAAPAGDGAAAGQDTTLRPIVLRKSGRDAEIAAPYETAAPTSYISDQQIERFRGSSPADIFRGTPGVMSGEARNGAGSIDVNIRGMQGMGRVATTVDGAENSLQIYQGYQGISNRTYVDPDLLAGVNIIKGSDASSSGIAGTVAMRTVSAADIIEEGKTFGLKVKGGFGGNTSDPQAGALAGYGLRNNAGGVPTVSSAQDGMDRPNFLAPTGGSGSIIAAMRSETVDLLAGYAYRKQGNYHAGEHGPSANPVYLGPRPYCYASGSCPPFLAYLDYVENGGLANYRAGEEVLNTQLETKSFLGKGTVRFGDGHSLELGYTGFRSEAGDLLASALGTDMYRSEQRRQTSGTKLDTGTFKYRWNPEDNDLIDLRANLWVTNLELRNPPRNSFAMWPVDLSRDFRTGSDTLMWGGEITNKSALSFEYGSIDLDYGLSYRSEDTEPSARTAEIEGWLNLRDAKREEAAAFIKAAYKPLDWLTINSGLRYTHFWNEDRSTSTNPFYVNPRPKRDEGGFSPSIGVTVEPLDGVQLYANYSNALRFPSLFESASAFTIIPNPDLGPERASNWEVGANFRYDGLISDGDTAMLKLGYFNWNVDNYIARSYRAFPQDGYTAYGMQVYNIDKARFSGLELSARYENNGFAAQLGASYYLNVEFCQLNGICEDKSMYADYATNHVPPEYSVDLTVSQQLLDEKLTVGGRVSYTGPRAIGHGQVTSQGLSQFISLINWEPFTLVDLFAEYKINENVTASVRVENVFDRYYIDPLGLVQQPGPGRTFYASLTAKF
jgi:hemoglobin/transferrin/lactoferrin receptor protein